MSNTVHRNVGLMIIDASAVTRMIERFSVAALRTRFGQHSDRARTTTPSWTHGPLRRYGLNDPPRASQNCDSSSSVIPSRMEPAVLRISSSKLIIVGGIVERSN